LQDFFCMAWQGADWDGKATADTTTGWKPCPSELRYASKDVSRLLITCHLSLPAITVCKLQVRQE
jgi:hypothetical protein